MASSDYISREAAEKVFSQPVTMSMCLTLEECKQKNAQRQIDLFVIRGLPAADVLPRDEAIKMGAELAAMHGSDATSQQLEEAYLKGVEDGMTRRDVRPVVRGEWKNNHCSACGMMPMGEEIWESCDFAPPKFEWFMNFCPNCGARMLPEPLEEVADD